MCILELTQGYMDNQSSSPGDMRPVEQLWSPAKVATYVGVTSITVYRWIKTGYIQDARKIGRSVRIPLSEVHRIMNLRKSTVITRADKQTEE